MKKLLPFVFLFFLLSLQLNLFASGGSSTPAHFYFRPFAEVVRKMTSSVDLTPLFETGRANGQSQMTGTGSRKICVCQLLDMYSTNYRHENRVLLAEKTNNGDLSGDAEKARMVLEREKRHLKDFFYDRIRVSQMLVEGTDCQTFFKKLSADHAELVLYEILDADIHR